MWEAGCGDTGGPATGHTGRDLDQALSGPSVLNEDLKQSIAEVRELLIDDMGNPWDDT